MIDKPDASWHSARKQHDETAPSDTPEDTDDAPEGMRLITDDVSCQNCAHRNICALYAGIAPMLESWQAGDGEPPIELDELAVICAEYLPADEVV